MINGFVYAVAFHGKTPSEFRGLHPAVVIQNFNEPDLYYAFPLTHHTTDRENKYKKKLAHTLKNKQSIVLIHKMQIFHKSEINNLYISNGNVILIPDDDMKDIIRKFETLIQKSTKKAFQNSSKARLELSELYKSFSELIENNFENTLNFQCNKQENCYIASYQLKFPYKCLKGEINKTFKEIIESSKYANQFDTLSISFSNAVYKYELFVNIKLKALTYQT